MPKYILHGGREAEASPRNDGLYDAIADFVPKNGRILMVYFAREEALWAEKFALDEPRVKAHLKGKNVSVEMATIDDFEAQFNASDVVYFRGGKTNIMMETYPKVPSLKQLIQNAKDKLIVGASAGANLLSSKSLSRQHLNTGLGAVPVAVWVHSDNPEFSVYAEDLKKIAKGENLPLLHLPEYKHITLEY